MRSESSATATSLGSRIAGISGVVRSRRRGLRSPSGRCGWAPVSLTRRCTTCSPMRVPGHVEANRMFHSQNTASALGHRAHTRPATAPSPFPPFFPQLPRCKTLCVVAPSRHAPSLHRATCLTSARLLCQGSGPLALIPVPSDWPAGKADFGHRTPDYTSRLAVHRQP